MSENVATVKNDPEVKEEGFTIEVEPVEFVPHAEMRYMNTKELERLINSMFAGDIAPDYMGCKILLNDPNVAPVPRFIANTQQPNSPYLVLRFSHTSDNADPETSNIIKRADAYGNDGLDRIVRVLGTKKAPASRLFVTTQRTKDMLTEFLPDPMKKNPQWDQRTEEHVIRIQDGASMTREITVVEIYGLSIEKFIAKIYGNKLLDSEGNEVIDKEGKPVESCAYHMNVVRQIYHPNINPMMAAQMRSPEDMEYLISITKMSWDAVDDVCDSMYAMKSKRRQVISDLMNK